MAEAKKELIVGRKEGKDVVVSLDDLPAMEAARDQVEQELASIRQQITQAKATAASEKVYADPEWYAKIQGALRFKGYAHQKLIRRIAELRRKAKSSMEQTREQLFIDSARRRLKPEVYKAIWDEVDELSSENSKTKGRRDG